MNVLQHTRNELNLSKSTGSLLQRHSLNKLCVREILSLSFVCGASFFEFRGRNLVCFGIAYNFDGGRHWQIRAGSREGTHAHCVFHASLIPRALFPGFGGGARKGPGIGLSHDHQTSRICGCTKLASDRI